MSSLTMNLALARNANSPACAAVSAAARMMFGSFRDRRGVRVALLLTAVTLLSLFDLVMTLDQMRTTGMAEGNPLVVHVIRRTQSPAALIAYKMLTVAVSVGMLFRLRKHWQAEVGVWAAVLVLSVLTIQWMRYANYVGGLGPSFMASMSELDSRWLALR